MKLTFLFLLITFAPQFIHAQDQYTGLTADNYMGMTAVRFQPAEIVDNRHKFYISSGYSFASSNNFNALNFNNLIGFKKHPQNEYRNHNRGGFRALNFNTNIISAMAEYKHKNAFGYNLSINTYRAHSGLPAEYTFADFNGFKTNPTQAFNYKNLRFQEFTYLEHSFNYGRIIKEDNEHYLKAGVAVKLINGLSASYLYSKAGQMKFSNATGSNMELTGTSGPVQLGEMREDVSSSDHNLGIGFDLGAVYEHRPNYDEFTYNMDGKKNIERYDQNKYDYKIGVSITNIGSVKFLKDTSTYDFDSEKVILNSSKFDELGNSSFDAVKNAKWQTGYKKSNSNKEDFRMTMPTSLNLQFDYHIYKNFYAAYAGAIPLGSPSNPNRVKNISTHSIIPRYETSKFGVSVPISLKGNGQFNIGGSVRVSSKNFAFFMGSNNVTYLLGKRKIYDGSIYAGISLNMQHFVPADRDFDEVSDKLDRCPDDKGLWKYKGCPDTDNDGIIDLEDHCIYDQGKVENNGCPDRDGDGVIDLNDHCPDDAGLAVHYGCPDRDKDGVIDVADRCPDVPGIEFNNGCPIEKNTCCLDRDGDGLTDDKDECPDVPGSVYNRGCPIDSTNINTINLNDTKPNIDPNHTGKQMEENDLKKESENGGFDPIQISSDQDEKDLFEGKEIERLIVNFESDESYIEQDYIKKIDGMLRRLNANKNENLSFIVIGHTDSDGEDAYNLILSRKRSETVRKRLMNKGIDFDRIKTYYYGEAQLLNSSNNEVQKKSNRRVEIIVIKN